MDGSANALPVAAPAGGRRPRDLRADVFRGLALWFIFIDHIPDNWLGHATLRNFALCDATEAFVLLAGYAGGGLGLTAVGAQRSELVGTAAGGVAYRLPSGLDLFASASAQTGRDDHQETITAGVRLRF